jgi:anhydro-N-acetylmuramic acid kinase
LEYKFLNTEKWMSQPRNVLGLMTGTSLDGIDLAFVRFWTDSLGEHNFQLLAKGEYSLPNNYAEYILDKLENGSSFGEVSSLHFAISEIYSEAINTFINDNKVNKSEIDAVAIHGQTVWHEANGRVLFGKKTYSTLQLGSGSVLSKLINLPVVSNFRDGDLALGGSGAPLVPIFDYNFISDKNSDRIALNIGGMANLTYLKSGGSEDDVLAFDSGVGNVLIDMACQKLFNKKYDKNGTIAKSGKLNNDLFNHLLKDKYILLKPPKSTGREYYSREYFNNILNKLIENNINKIDLITTLTHFTAYSISENIKLFLDENVDVFVSGGGAKNNFLIELLREYLPKSTIYNSREININPDFKEAICFAYLGWRTFSGLHGNMPSVTGASKSTILGTISF